MVFPAPTVHEKRLAAGLHRDPLGDNSAPRPSSWISRGNRTGRNGPGTTGGHVRGWKNAADRERGKQKKNEQGGRETGCFRIMSVKSGLATVHTVLNCSYCMRTLNRLSHILTLFGLLKNADELTLLVHCQVTIIFIVSVGLSVCLFVQSFSQPSLIRFRSNLDICYVSGSSCVP